MEETIAAIATPLAMGGISVIRISGETAFAAAERIFLAVSGKKPAQMKGYSAAYGSLFTADEKREFLDNGIITVFHAPHSYTGEDVVEISCHGGILITREVLRNILLSGARLALPGEFTKRAFLNGKLDLTQAEAISDLISSTSRQAMRISGGQAQGSLHRRIEKGRKTLTALIGRLAVWADYPEEDVEEIDPQAFLEDLTALENDLARLIAEYDTGCMLKNGVRTVIVGKPNVGKSTLMNLLSRQEKSIVTDIPGTTRDVVEDTIVLHDVVLHLSDTAGIRDTDDLVESFGVKRAIERLDTAQLILAIYDYSQPLSKEDFDIMEQIGEKPAIAIVNKNDLEERIDLKTIREHFEQVICISAQDEESFQIVEKAITAALKLHDIDPSLGMIANERQLDCVFRAKNAVSQGAQALKTGVTYDAVTVLLEEALQALLELTGDSVSEEVVHQVFSNFCVGK